MFIGKEVISAIVVPLTYICNLSFQLGCFPDKMKIAKVIPLFKAGDKKNYTQIIDQFHFYRNFQRYLKNFLLPDWAALLKNTNY